MTKTLYSREINITYFNFFNSIKFKLKNKHQEFKCFSLKLHKDYGKKRKLDFEHDALLLLPSTSENYPRNKTQEFY